MRYVPDIVKRIYDNSPVWTRSYFSTGYSVLKSIKERNELFNKYSKELSESQWLSLDKLENLQNERLNKIIIHANETVPYYNKLFVDHGIIPSQIQSASDVSKIPFLTKKIIRENFNEMFSKKLSNFRIESTSGTTGTPLSVAINSESSIYSKALIDRGRKWMGYDFGKEWIAILNGYQILPLNKVQPPFWIKDFYNKLMHLSSYHIDDKNIKFYYQALTKQNIKFIQGYPSTVASLARLLIKNKLNIQMKGVWLSSEPIYDWQMNMIKSCFNCKIYSFYGQSEGVATAMSCGESMSMHFNMESSVSELAPNDYGQNVLIATSLTNYAMPLIRYQINDLTDYEENECLCGRKHKLIKPIKTKSEDFLLTPQGKIISASLLTFPFKNALGIEESQIVQKSVGLIELNVIKNDFFSNDIENKIVADLKSIIGNDMKIEVKIVNKITRTKNGKFRFVISELPHEFIKNDLET
ncbi:MAG: phenylacetate--CoA ligase family protein [Candidatus Delongbacteria bacterium]